MKQIVWTKFRALRDSRALWPILIVGFLFHGSPVIRADDGLNYFTNPQIDYWTSTKDQRLQASLDSQIPTSKTPTNSKGGPSPFPWKRYLDPKNDEFFKEGDYTPPAPFMEIARNPSDENIANWYQYLQTKNELAHHLQAKLSEYASQHGENPSFGKSEPEANRQLSQRLESPAPLTADARRFRLRMYFDSHCPHCEHMMGTLTALAQRGYTVELRQVDGDSIVGRNIPFPVERASTREKAQYQVEAVPLLLIGDLQTKSFFKIQGYQTEQDVMAAIAAEARKPQTRNSNKEGNV